MDFVIENGILTQYTGPGGEVLVPDGVTEIAKLVFSYNARIHTVTLPESVTVIGTGAFCHSAVTRVNLPKTLTQIGARAFIGCKDLESVCLPESLQAIGEEAFLGCKKLQTITIPEGITVLASGTFMECENLSVVILPQSLTTIDKCAFQRCLALTHLEIPPKVQEIGSAAFSRSGLIRIRLPEGVTWLNVSVFSICKALVEVILPESLQHIRHYAFYNCPNLREITLPAKIRFLGAHLFAECENLRKITVEGDPAGGECFHLHNKDYCLIAPKMSTETLKKAQAMTPACVGFVTHRELFTDPEIIAGYESYLTRRRKVLLQHAFTFDLPQMVAYYGATGRISVKNFTEEYLQPAQFSNANACVSWLLNWQNENISPQMLEKQQEREWNKDPFNAADMKKLWNYKTLEDGTLCITAYKGEDTDAFVPERIGRKRVTALTGTFARNGEITRVVVPEGVVRVEVNTFRECKSLQAVHIPASVTHLARSAFSYSKTAAIHAPRGSAAEKYAEKHKIPFVAE